jgi:hypothetical protein
MHISAIEEHGTSLRQNLLGCEGISATSLKPVKEPPVLPAQCLT